MSIFVKDTHETILSLNQIGQAVDISGGIGINEEVKQWSAAKRMNRIRNGLRRYLSFIVSPIQSESSENVSSLATSHVVDVSSIAHSLFAGFPNPQTPEQFDAFVKRIEANATRHPNYYRLRLQLLAVLGYAYIISIFSLICGLLWAGRYFLIRNGIGTTASVDLIFIFLGIGLLRLFLTRIPEPKGIPVKRSQAPALFKEIDHFTQALKAPRFHHVLLTDELNAAVAQRPRFGVMIWPKNYLLLGLPLMQVLSPAQFQAVMVHELGHLSGNDGRFSSWIYQVRRVWFDLAEQFELTHQGGWLFGRFFRWYGPFFKAYSFVLARANEYEADRAAARWVGVIPKAEALLQLRIYSHLLHSNIWPNIYRQTDSLDHPPDHTITRIMNQLKRGPSEDDARSTVELALMNATDNDDTHPCLSDRLRALGYDVDLEKLPTIPDQSAAQQLLGKTLETWMDQLDLAWVETNEKDWTFRHQIKRQQRQCLKRLQVKAQAKDLHALTIEETWQQAYLTWQMYNKEAAIPKFLDVLTRSPHHAHANYYLGKLLVEKEDWSGIAYVEKAMAVHPSFVIPGAELLYEVYQSRQQFRKAESYRQQRQRHQAMWSIHQNQRHTLNVGDRFVYHGLPPDECQQLAEYLDQCDEVQKAYIVRKSSSSGMVQTPTQVPVTDAFRPFAESDDLYVLGIVRQFIAGRGAEHLETPYFVTWLRAGMCFSADLDIIVFTHPSMPLCKAIQSVERSRLYVRPR